MHAPPAFLPGRGELFGTADEKSAARAAAAPGLVIAWVVVTLMLALLTRADPDLWGHVRFGLDFLRDHALPAVDPYSFTQDRPLLEHEWGAEVLMALAWRLGGPTGLLLLKAILVAVALSFAAMAVRGAAPAARPWLLLLVGWSAFPIAITLRPQLFTWLLLAALLAVLPVRRARWAVPLLFVAWANLHGGWVVGLGVLAVWACTTNTRAAWAVLFVSVGATLVNPYGINLWRFLWETVRLGRDIREWRPIWTAPAMSHALPWIVAVTITVAQWWRGRMSPWIAFGCLAAAFASLRVLRLVPLFVLVAAAWASSPRDEERAPLPRLELAVGALVVLGALALRAPQASCWPVVGDWAPDSHVELRARGTMLVPFGWGEYAIWRWGPQLRVSIDGRRETLYTDAVVAPQIAIERNEDAGLSWLDATQADVAWYPRTFRRARERLMQRGYRLVLETPESYVLARPGAAVEASARADVVPCFPAD